MALRTESVERLDSGITTTLLWRDSSIHVDSGFIVASADKTRDIFIAGSALAEQLCFNPLKCSGVRQLRLKVFSAIQV